MNLICFKGHDIMDTGEDLKGTQTSFDIMRSADLLSGITYYSNVRAYGFSDIHHTESSDGFKPDKTKPMKGIVFDGIGTEILLQVDHFYEHIWN